VKRSATFDASLDSLIYKIKAGEYGYIDEIFIAKGDSILYQSTFQNDYEMIGGNMSGKMGCGSKACKDSSEVHPYNYYHHKFHPYYLNEDLHTLQSITKSVLATIVGAAVLDGEIENIDQSIYPFFKEYNLTPSMIDHLKTATIKDLLTMELGLSWKEMGLSLEMESDVSAMEISEDWVSYVLGQEIENIPGEQWNYNSGASQLLSKIIQDATGKTLADYADQVLFKRLGIQDYYWKQTPMGRSDAEGGLYLKVEDLAKLGRLYLQNGMWEGQPILPTNWTAEALAKQVNDIYGDGGKEGYGYQWWLTADEPSLAVGLGYGNQILVINPAEDLIGVIYAWNIFDHSAKYIFRDFVETLGALEVQ